MHHLRIELRSHLDEDVLAQVLALIDVCTAIEGYRPVGEHKHSHLAVGAKGWVGVLAYEGEDLVGYAHLRWNAPEQRPRLAVEVVVHPDHHGSEVPRFLLRETRSVLGRAGGGLMYLWVHRVEDGRTELAALATRMGFTVQRELAFMTRPLADPPDVVPLPDGVEVRAYRPGVDDEALLAVNNAAFEGHPENGGWDAEELARRRSLPWFDADGVLLALRGGELLGFHWTKWHGHDAEEMPAHDPVGEVYVLGISPQAQGLGLGRALLHVGLAHLHSRGCRQAILYVDCSSTAAVRLYESSGFAHVHREICYEELVPPVVEHLDDDLRRPAF